MKKTFTLSALTIAAIATLSTSSLIYAEDAKPAEPAKPAAEKPAEAVAPVEAAAPALGPAAHDGLVTIDGVVPGKFTHDYDAAMASAKETNLPVMLVFTGSDWCGWCKIMDKNVFKKPEWEAYAKDNLIQVWLDYPRNKELVPEKYVERNAKLKGDFSVRGFPTYIIIDSAGSKLGQLGAGREKTPESFISEMKKVLVMTDSGMNAFAANLKPEDGTKVKEVFAGYKTASKRQAELQKELSTVTAEVDEKKAALAEAMETGKVNAMSELQKAEYEAAKTALAEAEAKVKDWVKANSRTKATPELRKQYNELNKAVQQAKAKIDSF